MALKLKFKSEFNLVLSPVSKRYLKTTGYFKFLISYTQIYDCIRISESLHTSNFTSGSSLVVTHMGRKL